MVGFDSELTIRREIDRVLDLHGADVRVVMEFDNIETIKRAIEIDVGVGLLPEPTVVREVAAGTLASVPLDTDELVRPLGIIHRRGKELSSTARRFIELLQREGRHVQHANDGKTAPSANGQAENDGAAEVKGSKPQLAPQVQAACGEATTGRAAFGEAEGNGHAPAPAGEQRDGASGRRSKARTKGTSGLPPKERRERVLGNRR
jgi:hypothetical protein